MKIVREDLYPKHSYPDKATRLEKWLERADHRKAKLAEKLDSNEMLIAAIRFYSGHLTPEFMRANMMLAGHQQLTRKWQRHLKAARWILDVQSEKDRLKCLRFQLPRNWEKRVFNRIGLPLVHPAEAEHFGRLNPNLEINEELEYYSAANPVLERAKAYLSGWTHSLHAAINNLPADTPPPVIEPVPPPPDGTSAFWREQIKRRLTRS